MFPYDKKDRKPLHADHDSLFEGFEDYVQQMIRQASQNAGKSFVYGYSAYTGPDGKTIYNEYSNIPGYKGINQPGFKAIEQTQTPGETPVAFDPQKSAALTPPTDEVIEPYHDVIDEAGHVKVIVDLPGVEKKDINVESYGRAITVKAGAGARKYDCTIELPAQVGDKPEKAEYKNGVLEIIYKKTDKARRIKID